MSVLARAKEVSPGWARHLPGGGAGLLHHLDQLAGKVFLAGLLLVGGTRMKIIAAGCGIVTCLLALLGAALLKGDEMRRSRALLRIGAVSLAVGTVLPLVAA